MSTTDPGPTSPTTVGSRPGGGQQRPQPDSSPRGSSPVRTSTSQARPADTGAQAAAGTQAPSRPAPGGASRPGENGRGGQPGARPGQGRQTGTQPGTRPDQDGKAGGQPGGRILPPPAPGKARPGQPPVGQARPGQPGQARSPRPGQPVAGAVRPGRPGVQRGPRRARLSLARLDPWSVLKLSFLLSVALGIVGVVVTAVLWNVVNGMGVFSDLNSVVGQVQGDSAFDVYDYVGFERMVSASVVISVVNVAIITALATLFAFIYNISSGLVGGLHVTLTDE